MNNKILFLALVMLSACSSKAPEEINNLRATQAQHSAELIKIKEDLRSLTGQIEELQYHLTGKSKELESKLTQLGARVPPPEGIPVELLTEDESSLASNTSQAAELFKAGLQKIREGDFLNAVNAFDQFRARYSDTAYTDNAILWIGIGYEKMSQQDKAISSFSQVFREFPAEDRAPYGLLYLAESFVKLGSKEEASLSLQKLIDDYPKSPVAETARKRLAELRPAGKGKKGK